MKLKITSRESTRPIEAACGPWRATTEHDEGTAWALYHDDGRVFGCASLERCQWVVDHYAKKAKQP